MRKPSKKVVKDILQILNQPAPVPRRNFMELVKHSTTVKNVTKGWDQSVTTYRAAPIAGDLVMTRMGSEMAYVQVVGGRPVSVLQLNEVVEVP